MKIPNRWTQETIFESHHDTSRATVIAALATGKSLADANLAGANLADANLAGANLAGANLAGANLADANLADAYLADAYLADANLAGANLAGANLAGANLADAYLDGANLADANLADAYLAGANLADADLADANLADAYLAGANLAGADLAGADLAGAKGLPSPIPPDPVEPYVRVTTRSDAERAERFRKRHPDVPVVPDLDKKMLEAIEGGGGLNMSQWHTCETTHCRAGWAVVLAGQAGKELESKVGPHRAGFLIYGCSTGRTPHFFASNQRAMEDIRACAADSGESTANA